MVRVTANRIAHTHGQWNSYVKCHDVHSSANVFVSRHRTINKWKTLNSHVHQLHLYRQLCVSLDLLLRFEISDLVWSTHTLPTLDSSTFSVHTLCNIFRFCFVCSMPPSSPSHNVCINIFVDKRRWTKRDRGRSRVTVKFINQIKGKRWENRQRARAGKETTNIVYGKSGVKGDATAQPYKAATCSLQR